MSTRPGRTARSPTSSTRHGPGTSSGATTSMIVSPETTTAAARVPGRRHHATAHECPEVRGSRRIRRSLGLSSMRLPSRSRRRYDRDVCQARRARVDEEVSDRVLRPHPAFLRQDADPADEGHAPGRPPRGPRADDRDPARGGFRRLVHRRRQPADHPDGHDEERRLRARQGARAGLDRGLRPGACRPFPRTSRPRRAGDGPPGRASAGADPDRRCRASPRLRRQEYRDADLHRQAGARRPARRVGHRRPVPAQDDRLGLRRVPPRPLHDAAGRRRPHPGHDAQGRLAHCRRDAEAAAGLDWNAAHAEVRRTLVETFAGHRSLSVQQTLHDMGAAVLGAALVSSGSP